MNQTEKNIEWLKENKPFLNISAIEKVLNMPPSTLKHFLNGIRDLPEKWKVVISGFISGLKK